MMKLRALLIIGIILQTLCSRAQTDGNLTQYYEVPSYFNPSAIGNSDYIRIRGGARMQWVGIDNAPKTFLGVADMPFKIGSKRLGTGVNLTQESIGLYKTLNLGAQIAYKLRKFGGTWSVGLQLGFVDQTFKGSEVRLPDGDDYHQGTDDAIPTTDIHGTAFDFGAGLWYQHSKFYAGISCTHLTSPSITMNAESASGGSETSGRKYEFQIKRTLYFTAGCNIPIKNTLFEVMPSMMFKTDLDFWRAELTGRIRYKKFLTAGIGYRHDDAVVAILGAEFKGFYIGYSYDYPISAINKASSGSHEITAGYSLKLDFSEKNKNKHKSIRIM